MCFWALPASVVAQPAGNAVTIGGVVLASGTHEPVAGATVFLTPPGAPGAEEARAQVLTDNNGRFSVEAAGAACGIRVEATDYLPWSDGAISLQAGQPRSLKVLLQPTGVALRAEVEALRLAWEEQEAQARELTADQERALGVLKELEQAINGGEADRALAVFSPTLFARADLGREAGEREPANDLLVLSAPDYPALQALIPKVVADGLRIKFVNPAVSVRGKWAEVEVVAAAALGPSVLAQLKQIAMVREGDQWRISRYTLAAPDPAVAEDDELARALVEEVRVADYDVETQVLLLTKISYVFARSWWGAYALHEAAQIAWRDEDSARMRADLYSDLLRRFPRPPGLHWFCPGVDEGGSYGGLALHEIRRNLADALYHQGLIEDAVAEYERCLDYFPDGANVPQDRDVRDRLAFIQKHDGPEREALRLFAEGSYVELVQKFPHSDLVDNALLELARQEHETEKTRVRYEEIIRDYADGDCVDDALYELAETYRNAIEWREPERAPKDAERAISAFREVIGRFPDGDMARSAQRRIDEIEERLARLAKSTERETDQAAFANDPQAALAGLRNENPETRRLAVEAFAKGPAEAAHEALASLVGDPDKAVRESVAWALGKLGTEAAVAALRGLLADQEESVRNRAQLAMLETQYTGDVVERPWDAWALPGRHFSMSGNQQPFVYEARGIRQNSVFWSTVAYISSGDCLTDRLSARYPVWGPERKEVAYVATGWPSREGNAGGDVWVVTADGVSERRLTTTGDVVGRLQWSPAKQVLFCRRDRGTTTVWMKDFTGEKQMTDWGRAWHPTYSPDGARIACVLPPGSNVAPSLFAMDIGAFPPLSPGKTTDDTNKRVLVDRVQAGPIAWSPDGRYVAFTDAEQCLSTIDVQTGAVRQLTQAPAFSRDVSPAWSPKGELLVFVRQARDVRTLWVVKSDRPGEQPLTAGRRFDEDPQFEGDGETHYCVYYCSSPNGEDGDAGEWHQHAVRFRLWEQAPAPG